jgi:hypothetical protein
MILPTGRAASVAELNSGQECSAGDRRQQNAVRDLGFAGRWGEFRYSPPQLLGGSEKWIRKQGAIMSRSLVFAGLLSAAALLGLVTANVAGMNTIAGARADDGYDQPKPPRKGKRHAHSQARGYTLSQGNSPAEIARYFQLYGGFIDPSINKQSQGGPFDSGFFFDSGINRNGGDSPYMN